ncbi:hypothetical protein CJF42_22720 [Pseudoalteromonas sp. NBT06-2]|uniref:hypothetical protein n=1 Tax=Pseudoalteromonas sp. NBT06-2 TaxID=2025950 RepID=UPI000BA6202A|nr:hypothetical protein [Pseudoalteromonas sp. NBT06-2]PAJ72169.1 hypothetical protein CJF42_22720 [Pseudoalteromonas sp. NBT06-2]
MHIVSGTLKEQPFMKDLGEKGFMWILRFSELTKDFKTSEKCYANYKALIFAKHPDQIAYFQNKLIEGAGVVVNSEKLKVELFYPENGGAVKPTLEMVNAKIENIMQGQTLSAPLNQQGGFGQQP